MTEVTPEPTTALVPWTGELVPLDDPEKVALAWDEMRRYEQAIKYQLRPALAAALAGYAKTMGTKTLRFGATELKLSGGPGSETTWDLEVLEELRAMGLPEERWDALVTETVSYKVNANVAKQLAAVNEDYARVIEAARIRSDRPWRVS